MEARGGSVPILSIFEIKKKIIYNFNNVTHTLTYIYNINSIIITEIIVVCV